MLGFKIPFHFFCKKNSWEPYITEQRFPFTLHLPNGQVVTRIFTETVLRQRRRCSCGYIWDELVGVTENEAIKRFL